MKKFKNKKREKEGERERETFLKIPLSF